MEEEEEVRVVLGRSVVNLKCGGSVMGMGDNCNHGFLVPANGTIVTSPSTGGRLTRSLGRRTRGLRTVGTRTIGGNRTLGNVILAVTTGIDTANRLCNSIGTTAITRRLTGGNVRISHGVVAVGSTGGMNRCRTAMRCRGRIRIGIPIGIITRGTPITTPTTRRITTRTMTRRRTPTTRWSSVVWSRVSADAGVFTLWDGLVWESLLPGNVESFFYFLNVLQDFYSMGSCGEVMV